MNRDGGECFACGETDRLVIHYLDGRGENSLSPNQDDDNLLVLCTTCHGQVHSGRLPPRLRNLRREFRLYKAALQKAIDAGENALAEKHTMHLRKIQWLVPRLEKKGPSVA